MVEKLQINLAKAKKLHRKSWPEVDYLVNPRRLNQEEKNHG
jgi:hypothetical protein